MQPPAKKLISNHFSINTQSRRKLKKNFKYYTNANKRPVKSEHMSQVSV